MRESAAIFRMQTMSGRPLSRLIHITSLLFTIATGATYSVLGLRPASASSPDDAYRTSRNPIVPIDEGWCEPPSLSKLRCWWWWINGNVTKTAITRDLEAMKAKGFGGASIVDAAHSGRLDKGEPPRGPTFATSAWVELFRHALSEADRLGLEIGLNIQSGWNLGGPTVSTDHAAKCLTWSQVILRAPVAELKIPVPQMHEGYYRDAKVIAVPLPGDDESALARIDNFHQKAYYSYPGAFTAADASHLLEAGRHDTDEVSLTASQVLDISNWVDSQGLLDWQGPDGKWLILRFGYTTTKIGTVTASEGWQGRSIDYLDPAAFEEYCKDVLTPLLAEVQDHVGGSLKYLQTDSWELGPVNWTPRLPAEFRDRRGYDLTRYMPVLAGYVVDDRATSNQVLNDFRRTLGELIADGNYRPFSEYAHQRGLRIHPESGGPHAAPIDALLCLGISDIPMGEFWARSKTHRKTDTARLFVKQPASAAHVYGKRIVMAESFTTIGPHWAKDPHDLKPVFDRVACEGLNLVVWHTFDCSPEEAGVPGNVYFAGTHLNPQVTWWELCDGFTGYLNRCQFLLQQGLPVSDVLYFYGENVPSFVRLKCDDPANVAPDYDYDVINLDALLTRTSVQSGRITLPDGTSYALLVLPSAGSYGLPALKHIKRLVEAGATVVGPKPVATIGLSTEEQLTEFKQLADQLWPGRIDPTLTALQALNALGVHPDFRCTSSDEHLDYFHRQTDQEDIFFVVNRRDDVANTRCSFRVTGRHPEIWDAVTGNRGVAKHVVDRTDCTELVLNLPPNGSCFVVFRESSALAGGKSSRQPFAPSKPSKTILGPWNVTFPSDLGGPGEVVFRRLSNWVSHEDPAIRYFSGLASYQTTLDVSSELLSQRVWLDLGEVQNLARVSVNGIDCGVAWTKPFRVEITDALEQGANELQIEVANLWGNRLIGDTLLPVSDRITQTNIEWHQTQDQLAESGLLGPVRLFVQGPTEVASRKATLRETE